MKKRFSALILSSLVLSAACASSHGATEPKSQPQKQEQPKPEEIWASLEPSAASDAPAAESEGQR